jgi:hypothetical protein
MRRRISVVAVLGLLSSIGVSATGLWVGGGALGFAEASASVYLDQAGLGEAVRPAAFAVADYGDPHDPNTLASSRVVAAAWSHWGEATATATGQARIQWADANTGPNNLQIITMPVLVAASGLHTCGGISVYTSLVISPAPGASVPPHFAQVQRDTNVQPCAVHGRGYVAGQEEERRDPNGCFFRGLRDLIIQMPFSLGYCAMRWKAWGGGTTTGTGVARIGFKQYGLRVRLSRIRWCRQWAISYTQETAEIWGVGETVVGQGNVSPSDAARLKALIGRLGQPHKTVHEAMSARAGCVG